MTCKNTQFNRNNNFKKHEQMFEHIQQDVTK